VSGRPLSLAVYAMAPGLAEPFAPGLLRGRARRGKEDPARLNERLGRPAVARPNAPLVWIHGVSVGESLAHLPLVERFRADRPEVTVLVTSGTRTSAELLARRLPEGVIHQYAPVDAPAAARRFAAHWRPDLAIFVESELWPNLLFAARAGGARLALLSARLSGASMRAWDRLPGAAEAMLALFDLILPQDEATSGWIARHGGEVAGGLDLKRAAARLPVDEAALGELRAAVGDRKVTAAASTHPGEEALIAEAMRGLEPAPLLVLAPRHPERGGEVAELLRQAGWTVARRSLGEPVTPQVEVYVADTLGELGLLYSLADVVVLGGSFVDGLAGHNPLEPARFARPVISGPHIANFADAYAELVEANGARVVNGGPALREAVKSLLDVPPLAHAMGERAAAVADQGRESFDRAWALLQPLVPAP
jgi:3-deoxy-D-manno-octulosonic-acid transferase